MYSIFHGFSRFVQKRRSYIDNSTFRLHYRTTFAILVMASILTTANQFIGDAIQCIVDGVPGGIMNTYCWIHGTFTIPSKLGGKVGVDVPHPGVAPPVVPDPSDRNLVRVTESGEEIRHAWYQWVCFVLSLQALLCYLPHYLWKSWEAGKLEMLIQEMDVPMITGAKNTGDKRKSIVDYFMLHIRKNNSYVFKFVFCEVLNLVNIVMQVFLMNLFLNGAFTTYGSSILQISELPMEDRVDPMSKVFPKVTKCTFHKYGPSGTVENKDGLCVLANNIINEKIYIFLWFWYMMLIAWTAIHLLLRLVTLVFNRSRLMLLSNRCKANNSDDVATILDNCYYGDWFLLMQMAKHIHPEVFRLVVISLRNRMDNKRAANEEDEPEME